MVSLHPYFRAKPGKLPEIKVLLPEFLAKTATETGNPSSSDNAVGWENHAKTTMMRNPLGTRSLATRSA